MADQNRTDSHETKTALGEGLPANVDIHRLGEGDNPQFGWDDAEESPSAEAAHGGNHANRGNGGDANLGRGRQTTQRNREIVRGKLYR